MSETTRNQMHDRLHDSLTIIAAAFARVDIRIGDPSAADLHTDVHHWQQAVWNSAGDLGGLNTARALGAAARRWVYAATAYTAYRSLAAEFNHSLFLGHIRPCESALEDLVQGCRQVVRS
ncbi:hypothetical protein ACWFMI_25065 [Nocardiopsis terrae]|uniref:hypothetical protein n=1 Tax=Streptomyces sp. NPDC057554 TaxID=3350538 RepID=UPI003676707C